MANKTLDTFLENTFTVYQVRRRLTVLQLYLSHQIFGANEKGVELDPLDKAWLNSFDADFVKSFNHKNITQQMQELAQELKKIPTLTLILPLELPENQTAILGKWIREKFQKSLLIEFKTDPSLIAGCVIIWNGLSKDYSMQARIKSQQEEILGSFKTFLK